MALRDQPYIPLYVQDYLTDEKLNSCSAASQGVYIKIMCILHKQEDYGTILLKQKDKICLNKISNFALKFAKLLPFDFKIIEEALNELIDEGVLIIEDDKIYQKRMVKDFQISLKRINAAKNGGGNPVLFKQKDKQKDKQNPEIEIEIENIDFNKLKDSTNLINNSEKFDFSKLKSNTQVLETIFRKSVTANNYPVKYDRFIELLDEFISTQQLNENQPKNQIDFKNHFDNWIAIQVRKPENHYKTMLVR